MNTPKCKNGFPALKPAPETRTCQIHRFNPPKPRARKLIAALAACLALAGAGALRAQTSATLTDFGFDAPVPGADDISQLTVSGLVQSPPDLNYYFDNSSPPGQTFTTGSNPDGYMLNSLSIATAGGGGGLPAGGQVYTLRIYSVSGSNATLVATYVSQDAFTFTEGDWLQWTGLNTPLAPNTQYAYTLHRNSSGWENLSNITGNLYTGGEAVVIPPGGGAIGFSSDSSFDAAFVVGVSIATAVAAAPPSISPASSVSTGTQVTLSEHAAGTAPLSYQWRTDNGTGGALTAIPNETNATLAVDTTGFATGGYKYDVIVSNATGSATSPATTLIVSAPVTVMPAYLSDEGGSVSSGPNDIVQSTGGGNGDGLNYYTDNGAAHGGNYIGQTFTTGTNADGYYLDSVAIQTGGGGSSGTTTAQGYDLYVFIIAGGSAAPIAHFTTNNFAFTFGDWLKWSGFSVKLNPNTTYAYGFGNQRTNSSFQSWAACNTSPTNTDLYSGGEIVTVPATGGSLTYGNTHNSDAVFDIGLLPVGVGPSPLPFAQPITISPSSTATVGTQVTLNEYTTNGTPPLQYQWRTDGGGGGALTNIPSAAGTNLVVDTTGWKPGVYQYDVIVQNVYGSSTSAVSRLSLVYANTTATLTDVGPAVGSPAANDIAQTNLPSGANSPDGLNYYFDNGVPPGQTFTTGNNPDGYVLTSLAIRLAGNSGGLPAGGQTYTLRLYTMSGSTANLYATYTSQPAFTFASDTDWVRWSGFSVPLDPNKTYAYSFARSSTGSGWDNLANVTNNPYAGGEVALIPTGGGNVSYGSSHNYDGTFVIGMTLPGYPIVAPPTASPNSVVYAGTPVTLSAAVTGTGPFTYKWQTDGGAGGTFTDVPGATGTNLVVDTTGKDSLVQPISYRLIAMNAAGATTSAAAGLTVNPAQVPQQSTDIVPSNPFAFVGGTLRLSTTPFTGTEPIHYQWQVDPGTGTPVNVPGQTNTTLVLPGVKLSDAGSYSLVASNSQGVTSTLTPAYVTIYDQPAAPFVVNFQWYSTVTSGGNLNDVGYYSGPGVSGFGSGTYWNQIQGPQNGNGAGTYSSLAGVSSDGIGDTHVGVSVTCNESWDWTSTPTIPLLDAAVTARANTPATFNFILPNGMYNLALFCCNGTEAPTANGGTIFTINGVSKTGHPTTDTSFVENDNYVVFHNLVVTDGSLTGVCAADPAKSYGSFNGAQLQYVGPAVVLNAQPQAGGQLKLEWSQGVLLEATSVSGPWTTNSAPSPYTVTPTGDQKYYRILVQ